MCYNDVRSEIILYQGMPRGRTLTLDYASGVEDESRYNHGG